MKDLFFAIKVTFTVLFAVAIIVISIGYLSSKFDDSSPVSVVGTNNGYSVEKLFTVDSISVYRFYDRGRRIYFTRREATYDFPNGKTYNTIRCINVDVE